MRRLSRRIAGFFDERYNMAFVRDFAKKQAYKRLPPHTGWPHVFGSLSLIAFLSQVVTGILLLIYYRPTTQQAYESIKYITGKAHFGWLYRQIHAWGATVMVLAVTLHMARTFFMGAYKKPRELTWVVGVLLFLLTIVFGFTGYLLPWNQLAYWATTVGTEVTAAVPVIGPWLQKVVRGGEGVGQETLSRFFTVHVIILPWAMTGLIALHLLLMRAQNLATMEPVGEEKGYPPEAGIPFWPVHVAKEMAVAMVVLGVLVTLSVLSPWEIGEPANPMETPEGIKPEWYFLPTFQMLKYFTGPIGKPLGILASTVPFALLLLWPFLDRSPWRHPRKRPISVSIGILAILLALFFGMLGYFAETRQTIFGTMYDIDVYGVPHRVEPGAPHPQH